MAPSLRPLRLVVPVLLLTVCASQLTAHTLKTTESVGVTFHLEPDHTPRAGEPAQVWFALTAKGGAVIPRDQCDCQLQVYSELASQSQPPLLQVPLQAISAEQYQNIPGASITFPQAGLYRLDLKGRPQAPAQFQAFEFSFPVTVIGGRPSPESLASTPADPLAPQPTADLRPTRRIVLGAVLGMGVILAGTVFGLGKKSRK